jgi:acyl dehydratase
MQLFSGIDELESRVGTHLGYGGWHRVPQRQIDGFADATGDHQWIHVDPDRAAADPFGSTIAHECLTLSVLPTLVWQIYKVDGLELVLNYGLKRVRLPARVPVGSNLRAGVELIDLVREDGKARVTTKVTIEREGGSKPTCVAESVSLMFPPRSAT